MVKNASLEHICVILFVIFSSNFLSRILLVRKIIILAVIKFSLLFYLMGQ
jgi:hypothetical protein